MKRVMLLVAMAAILVPAGYSQGPVAPQQVKSGEWVQLGTTINARANRGTKKPFNGVKVQGTAFDVVIEFNATKSASIAYKLSSDSKSDIYLLKGDQRVSPIAVIEDFPSWGADNDNELELLNPKDSVGDVTLNFAQRGWVSLLFDVPADVMKPPQNFKLMINNIKANTAKYSFVFTL